MSLPQEILFFGDGACEEVYHPFAECCPFPVPWKREDDGSRLLCRDVCEWAECVRDDGQGNLVSHLKYHFWNDPGQPVCFSNSEGYRGVVSASETPVEQNIWNIAEPISAAMWQRHLGL